MDSTEVRVFGCVAVFVVLVVFVFNDRISQRNHEEKMAKCYTGETK